MRHSREREDLINATITSNAEEEEEEEEEADPNDTDLVHSTS